MPEFKLEVDIPRELEKGNFSKVIMMCHDFVQLLLCNLMSSTFMYLNKYEEAFRYTNWLYPRSLKREIINRAYELKLLSDEDKEDILKIKLYRDTKIAHNTLFFDKQVLSGEIKVEEILTIIKTTFDVCRRLINKLNSVSKSMILDAERISNGEDINLVLGEHTLDKLIRLVSEASV